MQNNWLFDLLIFYYILVNNAGIYNKEYIIQLTIFCSTINLIIN